MPVIFIALDARADRRAPGGSLGSREKASHFALLADLKGGTPTWRIY